MIVLYYIMRIRAILCLCLLFLSINALPDLPGKTKKTTKLFKSRTESFVGRFHPYQDIMQTLVEVLTPRQHKAVTISTATGSVLYCYIRFAKAPYLTRINGTLEVTSLTGTFDRNMNPHIHIAVADKYGNAFGGHLPSLKERAKSAGYQKGVVDYDCPIFTTLEISLNVHKDVIFERKIDPETTYDELTISQTIPYYPFHFLKQESEGEQTVI